jgi:hypothetical protein
MFKRIVLTIWQLPQVILGLMIVLVSKAKKTPSAVPLPEAVSCYVSPTMLSAIRLSAISLGPILVFGAGAFSWENIVKHEYGHSRQSILLGPLYLLVVGVPSLTMNIISRFSLRFGTGKFAYDYYRRWPESWADRLGEVQREWMNDPS